LPTGFTQSPTARWTDWKEGDPCGCPFLFNLFLEGYVGYLLAVHGEVCQQDFQGSVYG